MIRKIKKSLLIVSSVFMLSLVPGIAVSSTASAANCGNIGSSIADGANAAVPNNGGGNITDCSPGTGGATSEIGELAQNIVDIFSYVVGAIAIIMIIYGGFRYITSGGDSNSVGNAKNTLIYAVVGLIIVALAQIIVRFVLNQTSGVS